MGVSPGLPLKCGGMTATSRSTVPLGTFGGMVTVSSGPGAVLFREFAAPPAPAPAAENACGSEVATASGVGEIVDASAWGWPSAGGAGACAAAPGAAGAALGTGTLPAFEVAPTVSRVTQGMTSEPPADAGTPVSRA